MPPVSSSAVQSVSSLDSKDDRLNSNGWQEVDSNGNAIPAAKDSAQVGPRQDDGNANEQSTAKLRCAQRIQKGYDEPFYYYNHDGFLGHYQVKWCIVIITLHLICIYGAHVVWNEIILNRNFKPLIFSEGQ